MRDWRRPGAGKTRGLASRAPACRWVTAGRAGGAGRARGAVAKVGAYAAARERRTALLAPWRAPACAAARHTGSGLSRGSVAADAVHMCPTGAGRGGRSSVPAGRGATLPWCGVLPGGRGALLDRDGEGFRARRPLGRCGHGCAEAALPGRAGCCSTGAATAGEPCRAAAASCSTRTGERSEGRRGAGRGERRGRVRAGCRVSGGCGGGGPRRPPCRRPGRPRLPRPGCRPSRPCGPCGSPAAASRAAWRACGAWRRG